MNTFFANFPFVRYCIALIIGILGYLILRVNIHIIQILLLILPIIYLILFVKNNGKNRNYLGGIGLIFLTSYGYYLSYQADHSNDPTNIIHAKHFDFYEAKITSLVEEKPKSWKAFAEVKSIKIGENDKIVSGNILLYFDKKEVSKPQYGGLLLIKGEPTLIEEPKNPNEFDYKKYLASQGVFHQQYLRDSSFVIISTNNKKGFTGYAYQINNYCDSVFSHYIKGKTELAVTNAMVLGLRDDIDNQLIQAYSAAGAIHVLSVSGLHVGVIYIILVWVFGFIKKTGKAGNWLFLAVILLILWLYAAITGFSSPVLRSTFMFSIILIAQNINRQDNSYNTLFISAFCLLVYNPFLITNVGFMLSYLAVLGMIQIQPLLNPIFIIDKRKGLGHWLLDRLWKVSTVAIAAQIATLPITIYFFHQFPNYFLLANPLVILLSSVVLIGGLAFLVLQMFFGLFGWILINKWMAFVLEIAVKALNNTVLFTEKLPGSISKYLNFTFEEVLIFYLLIFCLLALIQTKRYKWALWSIVFTSILICVSIFQFFKASNQSIVCLHAVPKATAISIIKGNSVVLMADTTFSNDSKNINYRLNSYWANKSISNVQFVGLPNETVVKFWKGKTFLFLNDKLLPTEKLFKADYLIIRNKKLKYFSEIKNKIAFKYLIIDGSISTFYSNRFKFEAASDGIYAHSLLDNGALIL